MFERTQQPLWGFHILNQQSTENFHQPITMGMKVEHKKPFLIYKANDGLSSFLGPAPPPRSDRVVTFHRGLFPRGATVQTLDGVTFFGARILSMLFLRLRLL